MDDGVWVGGQVSATHCRVGVSTIHTFGIRLVEGGLDLISPLDQRPAGSVRWADVTRIQTYKVDLLTTDCICLLFEFGDRRPPVQVSEECDGFVELFQPLSAAFPSIPPAWYPEVMSPAFATNHRVLYDANPGTNA